MTGALYTDSSSSSLVPLVTLASVVAFGVLLLTVARGLVRNAGLPRGYAWLVLVPGIGMGALVVFAIMARSARREVREAPQGPPGHP